MLSASGSDPGDRGPSGDEILVFSGGVDGAIGSPSVLSDEERSRAERFHFDRHRDRYVGRTGLLRRTLGALLGRDAAALEFRVTERGKPWLADGGPRDLRFNLSHSNGCVFLAVAAGREVGVDVEETGRGEKVERLAERVFDPRERAALAELPAAERRAAFFRGWTRKEAALKALGTGLLREPRELHVGLEPAGDDPWAPEGELGGFGRLVDLAAPEGFAAALAVEGEGWRVRREPF